MMTYVDIPSYSSILVTACEAEPDMCRGKMDQHVRPPQMQPPKHDFCSG